MICRIHGSVTDIIRVAEGERCALCFNGDCCGENQESSVENTFRIGQLFQGVVSREIAMLCRPEANRVALIVLAGSNGYIGNRWSDPISLPVEEFDVTIPVNSNLWGCGGRHSWNMIDSTLVHSAR